MGIGGRNTTKICWKCGKYHEDGDAYCIHCGASFASEDAKYQTDGRTVSNVDDKAYLTADPPEYKKNRNIVVFILVLCIVAVVAWFAFSSMEESNTLRWDYTEDSQTVSDGYVYITLTIYVDNSTNSNKDGSQLNVEISKNDKGRFRTLDLGVLKAGYITWNSITIAYPGTSTLKDYKVDVFTTEGYKMVFDHTIHNQI